MERNSMIDIKISAFSDEYADSFEEQLEGMSGFGIKYIEPRFIDGKNISVLTKEEVQEAKSKLNYFGIKASAIGSPLGKITLDGDISEHLETAKRVFETANVLGAKYIRAFSFYAPKGQDITEMKPQVVEALGKMVDLSEEFGVVLCHENEALIYGDTPARCRELLDYFKGRLKCVFDMGNFVIEGADPVDAYELLKSDIAYFHIKDALKEGAIVPPGKGDAQIAKILAAHKAYSKEDFFVSIEPHLQLSSGHNALIGRSFENPYQYEDSKSAFRDAVIKFSELI